jgi:hypothetical protein
MGMLIMRSFFALFAGLLIFLLWIPGKLRKRYAASSSWMNSQATILSAETLRQYLSGDDGNHPHYVPRISYSYRTGGADRQSEKICLIAMQSFARRTECEAWLASYLPGSVVPAWYDLASPTDSALELDKPPSAILIYVMALFCLMFLLVLGREIVLELMN